MKKRILAVLLLTALLPLSLLLTGLSLPEYYGDSYYAELSELYQNLRVAEGKKIVIIGGSNVAFGVDSGLLEELLAQKGYDYTVCNFGLYGAVGIDAMLELAEPELGEGDIAVLAIEPTSESFSAYFGATAFWKCAEADYRLLLPLSRSQKSALAGNYLEYLQDRLSIRRSGILPSSEGVYAKSAFDSRGDMVYDRPGNVMALGYDTAAPIDLAEVFFESAFVQQVNGFCERTRAKGAAVVLSFCPMNRSALADASDGAVYAFFSRTLENFSCPVISNPNDYILASGWFYDSNFHLNTPGARVRIYTLACDLLNYLGCFSALEFVLPEMPGPAAAIVDTQTDTLDFLFQPIGGGGYVVCGLSESGKAKASLTVPNAYEGAPVVGFTAQAFVGNTALVELTLPERIESIPDWAFAGCPNLRTLWLLHRERPPAIGEAPFAGTAQLVIRVPEAAYSLYRDGAGCAGSPWEDYLNQIEIF